MASETQNELGSRRRFEMPEGESNDPSGRPSWVDLIKNLRDESTQLLRQEVALAKAEMSEKAAKAARNLAFIVAGALVSAAALMCLAITGIVLIYLGLVALDVPREYAGWLAPLIMAVGLGAIGAAHIAKGIAGLKETNMMPERTVESLKRDKDLLQEKVTT